MSVSASGISTCRRLLIRARTGAVARNMTSGPISVKCASAGWTGWNDFCLRALGDDAADGREDAGEERQLFGPEMRPAIGDLAKKDRQEVRGGVDRSHEGVDEAVELLRRAARRPAMAVADALGDGREDVADDAGVEGALVREVVVDHRLVDACAAGDAIDGGGGEAVGAELVAGGGEDARSGVGCGAFGSRH